MLSAVNCTCTNQSFAYNSLVLLLGLWISDPFLGQKKNKNIKCITKVLNVKKDMAEHWGSCWSQSHRARDLASLLTVVWNLHNSLGGHIGVLWTLCFSFHIHKTCRLVGQLLIENCPMYVGEWVESRRRRRGRGHGRE